MNDSPKDPTQLLRLLDARAAKSKAPEVANPHPADPSGPEVPAGRRLSSFIPAAESLQNPGGTCECVTAHASLDGKRTREGYSCPVDTFAHQNAPQALALLEGNEAWAELDPNRIAYVDIETTSLQGGSGTVAFLVGIGRYENNRFCVRQYFMEDFDAESAMIEAVDRDLAHADAIVTYNGKRFDIPILEMRWRLSRRKPRFPQLHLDLLHPSRRLWKNRLPDCRLGTVERHILSIIRYSDAPSSEVPQIYFDFVRGIQPERIAMVFDHHAQDIFSLAALTQALALAVANPDEPRFRHASDQTGLARLFQRRGHVDTAIAALHRAAETSVDEDYAYRIAMLLGRALKRHGRIREAVELWETWAEKASIARLDPLIELAKVAEHQQRDHTAAERWTLRALEFVEQDRELAELIRSNDTRSLRSDSKRQDVLRRLQRLQRKLGRSRKSSES